MSELNFSKTDASLFRAAFAWAVLGVVYNLVEGAVSTWFGMQDETLALFGFGVDSFIEAISAAGIAHMVLRIRSAPDSPRDRFEALALRITGIGFYLLAASLLVGAGLNIWQGRKPETTIPGVVISSISIAVMWIMLRAKLAIGRALHSKAMEADAKCTQVCIYMSFVLLLSSAIYVATGIGIIDGLGAIAIAWFSYQEGTEALAAAAGKEHGCNHHDCE